MGKVARMNTMGWRLFPLWLAVAMAAVFAINGYMVYDALRTFPGAAGTDGFDLSNDYRHVLAVSQQQAALGWQVGAEAAQTGPVRLRLTQRDGAPLVAEIDAHSERPVGPVDTHVLRFQPAGDGWYQAEAVLLPGQWDIMLTVRADGHQYNATRRVFVK
jgi:nitrogen fixation protein FixH